MAETPGGSRPLYLASGLDRARGWDGLRAVEDRGVADVAGGREPLAQQTPGRSALELPPPSAVGDHGNRDAAFAARAVEFA